MIDVRAGKLQKPSSQQSLLHQHRYSHIDKLVNRPSFAELLQAGNLWKRLLQICYCSAHSTNSIAALKRKLVTATHTTIKVSILQGIKITVRCHFWWHRLVIQAMAKIAKLTTRKMNVFKQPPDLQTMPALAMLMLCCSYTAYNDTVSTACPVTNTTSLRGHFNHIITEHPKLGN